MSNDKYINLIQKWSIRVESTPVLKTWFGLYQQREDGLYRANKAWQRGVMPGEETSKLVPRTRSHGHQQQRSLFVGVCAFSAWLIWSHLQPVQPRNRAPLRWPLHWCGTSTLASLLWYRRGKHGSPGPGEPRSYPEACLPLNEACLGWLIWRSHKKKRKTNGETPTTTQTKKKKHKTVIF